MVYKITEELVEERKYYTLAGMRKIFAAWERAYPNHYIQIRPFTKGERTARAEQEILADEHTPIERPPAEYDNIKNEYLEFVFKPTGKL